MSIIIVYDPTANPEGNAIPGVPLGSLDAEALAQIPTHRLPSILAVSFYAVEDAAAWAAIVPPPALGAAPEPPMRPSRRTLTP